MGKKPRHNKMDTRKVEISKQDKDKGKEKDWGFDEILRSKKRGY